MLALAVTDRTQAPLTIDVRYSGVRVEDVAPRIHNAPLVRLIGDPSHVACIKAAQAGSHRPGPENQSPIRVYL